MLDYILKDDDTFTLMMDKMGYLDTHGILKDKYMDKPISEVRITQMDSKERYGVLKLGKYVKSFHANINNCENVDFVSIVLSDVLEDFNYKGNLLVSKIKLGNNPNFEIINGHLFNKLTDTIVLDLKDNVNALPNDPRIKHLDYVVNNELQAGNIYIGSNVMDINKRLFKLKSRYSIYCEPDNRNYKTIDGCLIDTNSHTLLKIFNYMNKLPNDYFNKITGDFLDYSEETIDELIIDKNVIEISDVSRNGPRITRLVLPNGLTINGIVNFKANNIIIYKAKSISNLILECNNLQTDIKTLNAINSVSKILNIRLKDNNKKITNPIQALYTFEAEGRYIAKYGYLIDSKTKTLLLYFFNSVIKEEVKHISPYAFLRFQDDVLIVPSGIKHLEIASFDGLDGPTINEGYPTKLILNDELESFTGTIPDGINYLYIGRNLTSISPLTLKRFSGINVEVAKLNRYYYKDDYDLLNPNHEVVNSEVNNFFLEYSSQSSDTEVKIYNTLIIHKNYNGPLKGIRHLPKVSSENPYFKLTDNALIKNNEAILIKNCSIPKDENVDTILGLMYSHMFFRHHFIDSSNIVIPPNIKNIEGLLCDVEERSSIQNMKANPNNTYIISKDGCLIDTINKRILSVKDNFTIPSDGSVTSFRYSKSFNFHYAVIPNGVTLDEDFSKSYKIHKFKDKTVITLRKRKGQRRYDQYYY